MSDTPLLQINDLWLEFKTSRGPLKALAGVSLQVEEGEIFGVVGETGCGKTVTGLSVLRLLPASATITAGEIRFRGQNLLDLTEAEIRKMRGRHIAMIFQNPTTALNPVFTIARQARYVIQQHFPVGAAEADRRMTEMLTAVGLPDVARIMRSYPHELSGGMQQRVMIALALALQPKLLIADEPTTALDVTIQAQILALLKSLRDRFGISIILITHNLGVVAKTCDRMAVLYAGRVVESGPTRAIFERPQHPYTQGLMQAIPKPEARGKPLQAIPGVVPSNPGAVKGCAFAPRCAHAVERCFQERPPLRRIDDNHWSACFLNEETHDRE